MDAPDDSFKFMWLPERPIKLKPQGEVYRSHGRLRSFSTTCSSISCLRSLRLLLLHTGHGCSHCTVDCSRMSSIGLFSATFGAGVLSRFAPTLSATGSSRVYASGHTDKPILDRFRHVKDPRALALILEEAEARYLKNKHPDPYIRAFILFTALSRALTIYQLLRSLVAPSGMRSCFI